MTRILNKPFKGDSRATCPNPPLTCGCGLQIILQRERIDLQRGSVGTEGRELR